MSTMQDDCLTLKPGTKVNGRWKVVRSLGRGCFGAVYEAEDVQKICEKRVALKLESIDSPIQVLKLEVAILNSFPFSSKHICWLYTSGVTNDFNLMVMSLLGPSVSNLLQRKQGMPFNMRTAAAVGIQCLQGLIDLHTANWLHRDVKPANFAMGNLETEQRRQIFIIDFGLSRSFKTKQKEVRQARKSAPFRGSLRYVSLNGHKGKELGRHDDLISLLYMTVELCKGELPWFTMTGLEEVESCKQNNVIELFQGVPTQFRQVHDYLYSLEYKDVPQYSIFHRAFMLILDDTSQRSSMSTSSSRE